MGGGGEGEGGEAGEGRRAEAAGVAHHAWLLPAAPQDLIEEDAGRFLDLMFSEDALFYFW